MKRRRFLTGVAGATLAAPFLPSLHRSAKAQAATPRRLVIFYNNNGCLTNRWFPTVENGPIDAAALAGKTLEPLTPFASKLLFPRGLAMFPKGQVDVNGIKYFDPHDQGMGTKLTGGPIDPTEGGQHYALQRSFDHVAAEMVNPGTKTPLVLSIGFASNNVKQVLSYSAAQTPYVPETNVRNVYTGLTGLFSTGGTTAADYRVTQGNSVLDCVRQDLMALRGMNMSGNDRRRLDDWMSLLRDTEKVIVSAACNAQNAAALGITDAAVTAVSPTRGRADNATAWTTGSDLMINLIALTMMCDANRMIVLQWPGFATFKWDGIDHQYDHHGLSHRVGSAQVMGTCVTGVIEMIHQIDKWYAGKYAKLVERINSVTEGDKTMLDNSAVMWLPELADGNAHNNNNLPIVIAGSAGGYLKQGQAVNLDGKTLMTGNSEASCQTEGASVSFNTGSNTGNSVPLQKLYVTLLNALGQAKAGWTPVTTFGVADTNTIANGITKPGELDALKA
jgi:hypothetical protein